MGGDAAKEFYLEFLQQLRHGHPGGEEKVRDGQFGEYMQVNIQNDGPVTLELESLPALQDNTKQNKSNALSDNLESKGRQNHIKTSK